MAKKRTRRTKKIKLDYVALFLLIISPFILFNLGFIGIFFANILRFFVGDLFRLFSVLLFIYAFYMLVTKKRALPLKMRQTIALIIMLITLLIIFQLLAFSNKEDLFTQFLIAYNNDFLSNTILRSLGGGIVGVIFTTISLFLFSELGTYFVLFLLIMTSIFLFSHYQLSEVLHIFTHLNKVKRKRANKLPINADKENKKIVSDEKHQSILSKVANKVIDKFEATDLEHQVEDEINNTSKAYQEDVKEHQLIINAFNTNVDEAVKNSELKYDKEIDEKQDLSEVVLSETTSDEDYMLPPVDLLNKVERVDQSGEHALIQKNSKVLEETFKSFGVNARVISANLGPSVTKFEVQPAVGVKVSKIVNLADDLALALAAKDIRIEAPIPGKSFVGIEVPNQTTSTVSFREIIENNINSQSKLEVPLGRDISGNIQVADLSKMPHLLVAGATGSGKSVAINGMITSILMKAKPSEVKLMMIDPKKVELNVYNGIPHLLTPVVTNPKRAANALQKVVQEMERRYELFSQTGLRNISSYNEQVDDFEEDEFGQKLQKLPYIVVIVDELADLMMVASNEVEAAIIRLAQMARAAGIHMVLATQRPSVDVITGLIKANVPSRMAFAVSSSIDSRTIIDSNGAEKLLGKGDMLFMPMGENKPIRVQGAFLSDSEVERIVEFVKLQQEANYNEDMLPNEQEMQNPQNIEDELLVDIVEFLKEQEYISVSMLQRKFRIGFNRAARLMEDLELRGYVGQAEGTKPRKVLQNHM